MGLVAGAGGLAAAWFASSLPVLEGRANLPGAQAEIELATDEHGIARVKAGHVLDAYRALGFAHARDRLWQMELQRRAGAGTLSELFGDKTLDSDRFMRALGLRQSAAANVAALAAASREILLAYADGVNAFIAEGGIFPAEFRLFSAPRPERWTATDSLLVLKLMAWNLSGNFWDELLNLRLANHLPKARLDDLFALEPGDESPAVAPPAEYSARELDRAVAALVQSSPAGAAPGVGSNAWVVSGKGTRSGKPLLANDPHLPLSAPAVWYLAALEAPNFGLIGATVPGLPSVILGRNRRVAWGYTNTRPDTQDLYVERVAAGDSTRYEAPGGSLPFARRREVIQVRGASDVVLELRSTRHGPVISDADPRVARAMPPGTVLALSWVGLRDDDLTLEFSLKVAGARSAGEVREALRSFHSPQENVVFADVDGELGVVAAGRVPIRRDRAVRGRVPVPGWDERFDWDGFIPFEELPQQFGRDVERVVSANQKLTPAGYPYWMTAAWAPARRARRIESLLGASGRHDLASFTSIQLDERDLGAARLAALLLAATAAAQDGGLRERLRGWDGNMASDRAEPLLFAEWVRQLTLKLYEKQLGALGDELDEYNPDFVEKVLTDVEAGRFWCGDAQANACSVATSVALGRASERLRRVYGDDPERWRWGSANSVRFAHRSLGAIPFVSRLFEVSGSRGGGRESVNVSSYFFDADSGGYSTQAGPGFRAIYDFDDLEKSRFIVAPGQSGHPLSRFYRNLTDDWNGGRYLPMSLGASPEEKRRWRRLTLIPG